jgi:hypothetical protein
MTGATAAGAMINPYSKSPAMDDEESGDFESMSESVAGDDSDANEDDTFTETEVETFDDDADIESDDDDVESDDDEGYF